MFVAHLPAAYVAMHYGDQFAVKRGWGAMPPVAYLAGFIGSVFPDIDLVYFYTFGGRAYPHHAYVTHWPFFWLALAVVLIPWSFTRPDPFWRWVLPVFIGNAFMHLVLDSFVGHIYWGAPFVATHWALFSVPARHGHFVANFLLHWSFGAELMIVAWAYRLAALRMHR